MFGQGGGVPWFSMLVADRRTILDQGNNSNLPNIDESLFKALDKILNDSPMINPPVVRGLGLNEVGLSLI